MRPFKRNIHIPPQSIISNVQCLFDIPSILFELYTILLFSKKIMIRWVFFYDDRQSSDVNEEFIKWKSSLNLPMQGIEPRFFAQNPML